VLLLGRPVLTHLCQLGYFSTRRFPAASIHCFAVDLFPSTGDEGSEGWEGRALPLTAALWQLLEDRNKTPVTLGRRSVKVAQQGCTESGGAYYGRSATAACVRRSGSPDGLLWGGGSDRKGGVWG